MRVLLTVLTLVLFVAACQDSGPARDDPSYAGDVQTLFNAGCVGCHGGGSPAANYSLTSHAGALGTGSDDTPNVIPGDPEASVLYQRLDDGTMPPSGRWDSTRIATVRNWILTGAKDN